MATLQSYHQPPTLDAALALLAGAGGRLAPLAGGTQLIGALETRARREVDGVVDLRKLGLDGIAVAGDILQLGATATLAAVATHPVAGTLADGLLAQAAAGEGPLNLRNMATVGGIVATAAPDSEFYAALLALDATVTIATRSATQTVPLATLTQVDGLITAVNLPMGAYRGALARVARTPADRPVVCAVAVRSATAERVALCGVALRPLLRGAELNPPDDFKGSAVYRRKMAEVLAARALANLV